MTLLVNGVRCQHIVLDNLTQRSIWLTKGDRSFCAHIYQLNFKPFSGTFESVDIIRLKVVRQCKFELILAPR